MNSYVRDNAAWLGEDKPRCRVHNGSNISINDSTVTALTFDAERQDEQAMHSTSSNTSRITVPSGGGGDYLVTGHIHWAADATGVRDILITVDGSDDWARHRASAAGANEQMMSIATYIPQKAAGVYFELRVRQDSGGALNVKNTNYYSPEFAAFWVAT